jgi:hypothetical protein
MFNELVVMPKEQFAEMLRDLINEEIEAQIGPLKAIIAVKQRDACEALGITDDTARNRATGGKVEALQRDGSRLVYFELKQVEGLKPRSNRKRG